MPFLMFEPLGPTLGCTLRGVLPLQQPGQSRSVDLHLQVLGGRLELLQGDPWHCCHIRRTLELHGRIKQKDTSRQRHRSHYRQQLYCHRQQTPPR